jgi:hypothetical protein
MYIEIIQEETAKLAKEKGFDDWCSHFYGTYMGYNGLQNEDSSNKYNKEGNYAAPSQTELQAWLREKYHLYVHVATNSITTHFPMIQLAEVGGTQMKGPVYLKNYPTYEEALEVGLVEALKLINI